MLVNILPFDFPLIFKSTGVENWLNKVYANA